MARDIGGDYNIKVSAKKVKNKTIRDAVYKKEKNKSGGKDFTSTRGFKVKERAGDKTKVNKKGEKVVVRKSGNRVVMKKSGDVVRKKVSGDRVISKKGSKATGPYVEPRTKTPDYPWITAGENPKYPPVSNYSKRKPR